MTSEEMQKTLETFDAWRQQISCEMESLKQKLKEAQDEIQRADDYRQIMNAMAAHSFCYNSQDQK